MKKTRQELRQRRKLHIRKNLSGSAEKPRIFVFQSNKFMYVGVADDVAGKVLTSMKNGKKIAEMESLGEKFGDKLKSLKVEQACFDRSGYKFHKRLEALVNGIRKSGISI